MVNPIALSSETHKDLKVDDRPGRDYGHSVNRTLVFSTEFGDLCKEFPILFHKDSDSGELQAHAILGLEADENLFIKGQDWLCNYVPAVFARGPFLLGPPNPDAGGGQPAGPVILVDSDDPRVGVDDGEPLFLGPGSKSPYFERVMRSLHLIHYGINADKEFFSCLQDLDLLEPVSIKATLSNIDQVGIHGYYTINQEKLAQLDGENLKRLNQLGILGQIFFVLLSLGNINRLIELKTRKAALA